MKLSKFQKGYLGTLLMIAGVFWTIIWIAQFGAPILNPFTYVGFGLLAMGTLIVMQAMEEKE